MNQKTSSLKNPVKVAIVIDQLLPGGVQKAAIQEVKNLKKLGFNTTLLILMRKGFERRNRYLLQNLKFEFLSDRYPPLLQRSFKIPIFKFLSTLHLVSPIVAPIKIKSNEFDIIISHGTTTSLTTWSVSKFKHIPYIAVIHDPMVYILDKIYKKTALVFLFPLLKPLSSILEKLFVKSSSLCLVDSNVHANFLSRVYGVKPKVVYLGINAPKTTPKHLGDKVISFGRWDKEKNLNILLDVATQLPKTSFIVAGTWSSGKDFLWFKNEIKKRKLQKRIQLIKKYEEEDLVKICRQGRVWIHPHFEAFSLSALEAASHGLPIIIPKKSGITELFREVDHGFFPKKMSAQTLKELILPLLKNKQLAWKMGHKSALLVRKNYTSIARAKILSNDILEILNSKVKKIVALEIGHVGKTGIAGGDRLLPEMVKHLNSPLEIDLIIPKTNTSHWLKPQKKVNLLTLNRSLFDRRTDPLSVFATYMQRIIKTVFIVAKVKSPFILYSSTGIFPDVVPAFFIKFFKPKTHWIARIHHISLPPTKRPGPYWVNLGAHILERISLWMIQTKANIIIVLNNNLKKELSEKKFDSDKMVVLGGGVDFGQITKTPSGKVKLYDAVFLGRLHYAKGVLDLAPIWKKVVEIEPLARLGIIGTGPEEVVSSIKRQIADYKLTEKIDLLNFIPQKKVWKTLKSSKIFLFCDHEAGFGLAVAEAMAAGMPVVGWDIGILGSVFKTGFIKIPLGNHELFAENIAKILKDKNLYLKLSDQAQKEAKKIDWSITGQKFVKILNLAK